MVKIARKVLNSGGARLFPQLERFRKWVPSGHFYSPVPSLKLVRQTEQKIWGAPGRAINGVDLNDKGQTELLKAFAAYYKEIPFKEGKSGSLRYFFENEFYSYTDAIFLYSMIRHSRPKRIVEVGSGFSSCVTLDTNELFFKNSIQCTFIEPFPRVLNSVLRESEKGSINLITKFLQDVDVKVFSELEANDILFIDSTHVSKVNSDVNHIFSTVLPALKPGVRIHFHDIFYPFEYPKEWVMQGRFWNEAYMLKAFLQYNSEFKIMLFADYLHQFHRDEISRYVPLCLKNTGGNIWLTRV